MVFLFFYCGLCGVVNCGCCFYGGLVYLVFSVYMLCGMEGGDFVN